MYVLLVWVQPSLLLLGRSTFWIYRWAKIQSGEMLQECRTVGKNLNLCAVNIVLSQIFVDLNIHWISDCIHAVVYLDIQNQMICFTLHDWSKFSLINESEAQLAPYCYDALWSSHNHQMVRRCTWTWWPVSTESAVCFSWSNVASDDTILDK